VSIIKRRTGMLAGAVALVLIAAGTAGAFAALHSTANSNSDVTADILAALGSDRVQSLKESDSVAVANSSRVRL
jgi:ferric-dicitrate binding protein FerR (iron transport regulator)